MPSTLVLLAVALASVTNAACTHEKLDSLPRGWNLLHYASHDEPIVLNVAIENQNLDEFEQRVYDISTPGHELYGQFLEGHEVDAFLQPLAAARTTVSDWLASFNVTHSVTDGDWVSMRTKVGEANAMLKTKFAWFTNELTGESALRTTEYTIPTHLTEHVDFIHPTIKFPSMKELRSTIHAAGKPKAGFKEAFAALEAWRASVGPSAAAVAPPDAVCKKTITPQCLLKLYNVHYGADATNGNVVSYASFLNESARNTDLTIFETSIAPYARGQKFTVVPFDGAVNDQTSTNDSTEANLDNQYIIGVGFPTPVTEFITPGCGPIVPDPHEAAGSCSNEPYLAFLQAIAAVPNAKLPQTLSVSYGEDEESWPENLAKRVCREFAKLGARGVSVMFASGDSGPGAICENNAGTKVEFTPGFPASCPFVTVVGATSSIGPEEAASFSGGGFSNYFKQPAYQKKSVNAFLKQLGKSQAGLFNPAGRGYPDVAAQGVDFLIVNSGVVEPVDGTSAASPTFASVITLLNSALISSGKKPLGFLNPFLYSTGLTGFTDIVNGASTGCSGGTMPIADAGWTAVAGWDAATGLGTPNFGKLLSIATDGKVKNKGGPIK